MVSPCNKALNTLPRRGLYSPDPARTPPRPLFMVNTDFIIRTATTAAELQACFDLRWQVLRAPWQQPRGSEQDDKETNAFHVMALINNTVVGVGRVHRTANQQTQIRYMAVLSDFQHCGIGTALLLALETKAREWQAKTILLNARENARGFYQLHHYQITGPAPTLFDSIDHVKMEKLL